jgi:hypothetical protein
MLFTFDLMTFDQIDFRSNGLSIFFPFEIGDFRSYGNSPFVQLK